MLKAYFNYPNTHITIHCNPTCGEIQKMAKTGQRLVLINPGSVSLELQRFLSKQYRFASVAGLYDIWLTVDFHDGDFGLAVVEHVRRLIANHYLPFAEVRFNPHWRQQQLSHVQLLTQGARGTILDRYHPLVLRIATAVFLAMRNLPECRPTSHLLAV